MYKSELVQHIAETAAEQIIMFVVRIDRCAASLSVLSQRRHHRLAQLQGVQELELARQA